MTPAELIRVAVEACRSVGIEYFITGSVASSYYGEFRFTADLDVVIELPSWRVNDLCGYFPEPDYYVSPESAMDAAQRCGQFNVVHPASGLKIDFMVINDRPYNESRRARAREREILPGLQAQISAPEDVILMKLVFYNEGASEKHLRDIASMLRISPGEIDRAYIERWAPKLGVVESWRAVAAKVDAAPRV